jgi:homoserine O-acetyltransferase
MTRHPPLEPGWIDRPHREASIGDLPLEAGGLLRDCRLVWVEHGERNAARTNTVLVCSAIGSTHHRLDFLIGEGRALDTRRLHVVAIDALGNGLSTSPSNSAGQGGAAFPRITIRDMVESQRRLLATLGIGELYAVVGASMGGMQALQWAVSHPKGVQRVVAMTAMARTSPWSQLMNEMSRRAMFEDAGLERPRDRAEAMRLWAPLTQLVTAGTPQAAERFTSRGALLREIAALEKRLVLHGPDPFDWACQTYAYDAHDLGSTPGAGGMEAALRSITTAVMLLAPPLDLYNPAAGSRDMARMIPQAKLVEIPSASGHRAASDASPEAAQFLNEAIGDFLEGGANARGIPGRVAGSA